MIGHYPKPQTGRGIYPGSGVHQGGQTGRPKPLHMGLPNAFKGGFNTKGSTRKFGTAAGAVAHKPRPKPLFNAHGPVPLTGKNPVAPPSPVAPPALGSLNTHDWQYGLDAARANYGYDTAGLDIVPLRAQLEGNKAQYDLGLYDTNKWNQRDFYDTNAALAKRGIVGMSNTVVPDVERKALYDRKLVDLSDQYGDAAAKRIMGQIDSIEAQRLGQRSIDLQDAEAGAYQRALENLAENPPNAPVTIGSAKPRPTTKPVVKPGPAKKPVNAHGPAPLNKAPKFIQAAAAVHKPRASYGYATKPKPTTKPVPVTGKKKR